MFGQSQRDSVGRRTVPGHRRFNKPALGPVGDSPSSRLNRSICRNAPQAGEHAKLRVTAASAAALSEGRAS